MQSPFSSAASILLLIPIIFHEIRICFCKNNTQSNFTTLLELCFCQSLHLTPDGLSPEKHFCISFCGQGNAFFVASWECLIHWDSPVHCQIRTYHLSVQLTALGSLITSKPRQIFFATFWRNFVCSVTTVINIFLKCIYVCVYIYIYIHKVFKSSVFILGPFSGSIISAVTVYRIKATWVSPWTCIREGYSRDRSTLHSHLE